MAEIKPKAKVCGRCKVNKPWFLFYKSKPTKDGLHNWCKDCVQDGQRKHREANPELRRVRHLAGYGLTPEAYDEIYVSQQGLCLVCREQRALVIDHCHSTGIVRGLLCSNCNAGIGMFGDHNDLIPYLQAYFARDTLES